jgi:hypothetical protein
VDQILQKELQPLEARIKSMVQDIARKCLSDLVRDWQTSESGNFGSSQRSAEANDIAHTYSEPGPSSNSQGNFYSAEAQLFHILPDESRFASFDFSGSNEHHIAMGTSIPYNDLTQTGDWMCPTTAESRMNTESFSFQGDMQNLTFFCLQSPPHSEAQSCTGKGKGRADVVRESQDQFCPTCFPHNDAQAATES